MRWKVAELAAFTARRSGETKRGHVKLTELRSHIAIAEHLRTRARPGVVWWHTPNGELRNKATAAKLKAMGVKPGVPDITLLIDGRFFGLEIKSLEGRLSSEQRATHAELERAGAFMAVAHSIDGALAILTAWGAITPDANANNERGSANG